MFTKQYEKKQKTDEFKYHPNTTPKIRLDQAMIIPEKMQENKW